MNTTTHLVRTFTLAILASAAVPAQWSADVLSAPRAFPSAATVGDLALFAGGGANDTFTVSDIVDVYDASTDSWSVEHLSEARGTMGVAVLGDLVFFAGGGSPSGTVSDVVDVFDSSTGLWSTAQPLTQARAFLAGTSVGNKLFFAGGAVYDVFLDEIASDVVDIYDADVGLPDDPLAWSATTLSKARTQLSATSVGSRALFAGGRSGGTLYKTVDIYDDSTGSWTVEFLSVPRTLPNGCATSVGSLAFFAGGQFTGSIPFAWSPVVDIYDAQTGTWSTTTMSVARSELAVTAVGDTVLFAGGATGVLYSPTDIVESYDVGTGQWGPISHLSDARYYMAATTVDGKAIFAGGQQPGGMQSPAYDTMDIYEPGPWTNLAGGTLGIDGTPWLYGTGDLVGGSAAAVSLTNAPPAAFALAWVSVAPTPFAALGGTVHAYPFLSQLAVFTDAAGKFSGSTTWPASIPMGTQVWFQLVIQDLSSPAGLTLSNGLHAITP